MQNQVIKHGMPILPSKTDSVIRNMQYKIDSLEKITTKISVLEKTVQKTEIGTGFFSEVIGLQLAIFLFIVGIAGWFSWKRILRKSRIDRAEVLKQTRQIFSRQKKEFDTIITNQKAEINRLQYNVSWTILKSVDANDFKSKFLWNITCASSISARSNKLEVSIFHLEKAREALKHIENGALKAEEFKERFDYHMKILNETGNDNILAMLPEIIERSYEIMYSKEVIKPPLY